MFIWALISLLLVTGTFSSPSIIPYFVGSGWQLFSPIDIGSPIITPQLVMESTVPTVFILTDTRGLGDIYQIVIDGILVGQSSLPAFDPTHQSFALNPDVCGAKAAWSRFEYLLTPGTHTIVVQLLQPEQNITDAGIGFMRIDYTLYNEVASK